MSAFHSLLFFGHVLLCAYLLVGVVIATALMMAQWKDIWDPEKMFRESVYSDESLASVTFTTWYCIAVVFARTVIFWAPTIVEAIRESSEEEADEDTSKP